jgi:hypothetical protein
MQIKPFGIAAMALAVSVLASPLAQAKSYLVKVDLQCSVNPNGPPYSVVALNLIPPNGALPNNWLPQGRKIYWKAFNQTGSLVLPYPLPPAGAVVVGHIPKYVSVCKAWHYVCNAPPAATPQKFC